MQPSVGYLRKLSASPVPLRFQLVLLLALLSKKQLDLNTIKSVMMIP